MLWKTSDDKYMWCMLIICWKCALNIGVSRLLGKVSRILKKMSRLLLQESRFSQKVSRLIKAGK